MFLLFLSFLGLSYQFNLDTQSVHVIKSDNGLFGFTVALHKTGFTNEKLVLIGSPNANTGVEGVEEGGALFKCAIPSLNDLSTTPVECSDMVEVFNDGGNGYYDYYGGASAQESDDQSEDKSHQFLGVSMVTSDDYVAVCAHRYEHRFWVRSYLPDLPRQLIGRCFVSNSDFDNFDLRTFKPCDNAKDSGYETYGYCQAGISVALRNASIVMGAPGTNLAVGSAFLYDLENPMTEELEMERIAQLDNKGSTADKYIGYSSAICNLDGDDFNGLEYVFGGPRGHLYSGEVRIYTAYQYGMRAESILPFENAYEPSWSYTFKGEQMGSYFGHSLICADVNGDGYEDIIVGAPWYSDYSSDILPDIGRIYVIYGSDFLDDIEGMRNPQKISGDQANGAFGFSIANAGDMNDDGFTDVFVGAPYYDDGEGAVFLYLGGESGLFDEYSQVIKPSTLNVLDNLRTFGWSISEGKDMDGNGYPDIAIGAYKSGHVTYIRSKSIIDVVPRLNFKTTVFNDTHRVSDLQVCLHYEERPDRDPIDIAEIPIRFSITLDPEHFRLSFSNEGPVRIWVPQTMNVSTTSRSPFCTNNKQIFYDNSTGNVQPLPVVMSAQIDDPSLTSLVLNQQIIDNAKMELTIQSECHPDTGICTADLTVELDPEVDFAESHLYPTVVFGYVRSFTQKITVKNIGTAQYNYVYNGGVNITYPPEMIYLTVPINDASNVNCEDMSGYLLCRLSDDGPINKPARTHTFGIEFEIPDITEPMDLDIRVEVFVEDPTIDEGTGNNVAEKEIQIKELADLVINGGSTRSSVAFNNQYTVVNRAIGSPELDIKHEYSVELKEDALKSSVENVTVKIFWPQKIPMTDISIVPLYNMSLRTPEGVDVFCVPDPDDLYPEGVGDKKSLKITDELELPVSDLDDFVMPGSLSCADNQAPCQQIKCSINTIRRGAAFSNGFKVSLFAKVHEANLYGVEGMNITSFAKISGVYQDMVLPLKRSATAKTVLYASQRKSTNLLWIIIGAVIGGLLFLFLLILCLWKCGFFKRKQPPTIKADKVDEQIDMTVYGQ